MSIVTPSTPAVATSGAELSINDVAAYALREMTRSQSCVATSKLHAICYLAQGWSLALLNRPLFSDEFAAGKTGPVSREFRAQMPSPYTVESWPCGEPDLLDPMQRALVGAVTRQYGGAGLTGMRLRELIRNDDHAWRQARLITRSVDRAATISHSDMRASFQRWLKIPPTLRHGAGS